MGLSTIQRLNLSVTEELWCCVFPGSDSKLIQTPVPGATFTDSDLDGETRIIHL